MVSEVILFRRYLIQKPYFVIPRPTIYQLSTSVRKVKEAWGSKRDVLVKSGSFAIEQLSEALSTKASLDKLPDGQPQESLDLCAEQVRSLLNLSVMLMTIFIAQKLIDRSSRKLSNYSPRPKLSSVS